MSRTLSILALILLVTSGLTVLALGTEGTEDVRGGEEPPSRYGYTPEIKVISTPASEAICVATGDFDGARNDDLAVGLFGSIQVFTNNGLSGDTFGMTLSRTISLPGYYITRIDVADYDNDGDDDIIALGQEIYIMADETTTGGPSRGNARVYYIENTAGSFSIETYHHIKDSYQYASLFYYSDCKFDITSGDLDGDNDIDTVFAYQQDHDGVTTNGGESVVIEQLTYSSSGLVRTELLNLTFAVIAEWTTLVELGDLDGDGDLDLVYSYGGLYSGGNALRTVKAYVRFNQGSSFSTPVDLDPNSMLVQGGGTGGSLSLPFALAIGDFVGGSLRDIAVGTNLNMGENPAFGATGVFIIKQKSTAGQFEDPDIAYSEDQHFMFRDLAVGRLDNATNQDLFGFTKMDTTPVPSSYNSIDDYGLTFLSGRSLFPYRMTALKVLLTVDGSLPMQVIKGISIGNFDNDPEGYDDIVYVGGKITVGLTSFPPNNIPYKVRAVISPQPVENKNNIAKFNITVEDMDGSWDLSKLEVDFSSAGLPYVYLEAPRVDPGNKFVGYYEFEVIVPDTVKQGDYTITFNMYDMASPREKVKASDSFLFRVKQYNRKPQIALENRTLIIMEDTPTYFTNVYDWFIDQDIEDGLAYDLMEIDLRNSMSADSWPNFDDNDLFRAELANGSDADPYNWTLLVTPKKNLYNKMVAGEPDKIIMRASDGGLYSENLALTVKILSVNDIPTIPLQGVPKNDFTYQLKQDDFGSTIFKASDANDGDPAGSLLRFYFDHEDDADRSWLTCDELGRIAWKPLNKHYGSHKVTAWVSDGKANISQVLFFNVSNVIDAPIIKRIANQTKEFKNPDLKKVYDFVVYEHEEFNLTIEVSDLDQEIGLQDMVLFQSDLTLRNNTYLDIDPKDPFKAYLHFFAEGKYGYLAAHGLDYPPIEDEIIVLDQYNQDVFAELKIRITILNVNDPPIFVSIDTPAKGAFSPILYNIRYSAGSAIDPDMLYNDTIEYQWDFDASDGWQVDRVGETGYWNFPRAGNYTITIRAVDSSGAYVSNTTYIVVDGVRDDDDYDNDGLPNEWEDTYSFNKYDPADATMDSDGDELSNIDEYLNGTDPKKRDTDGDGFNDKEDYAPLDKAIWEKPVPKEKWTDDPLNILLLIVIILVVVLLLIALIVFLLIRSRKRSREEEERRKQAELMQKSVYEGQDLYGNLPAPEQAPQMVAVPQQPALPPPPESGSLDDVFGGAGTLPGLQPPPAPSVPGLPPASQPVPPPSAAPPQAPSQPGQPAAARPTDLTDLLG